MEETKEAKPGEISKAQRLFWAAKDSDGSRGLGMYPVDRSGSLSQPTTLDTFRDKEEANKLPPFL